MTGQTTTKHITKLNTQLTFSILYSILLSILAYSGEWTSYWTDFFYTFSVIFLIAWWVKDDMRKTFTANKPRVKEVKWQSIPVEEIIEFYKNKITVNDSATD